MLGKQVSFLSTGFFELRRFLFDGLNLGVVHGRACMPNLKKLVIFGVLRVISA